MRREGPTLTTTAMGALALAGLTTAAVWAAPAVGAPTTRILGPDPAACVSNAVKPAALVRVVGLKDRAGQVRVQIYPSDPDKFLESGEWIERVDVPVTRSGHMDICVKLPRAGELAMVVMHDRGADGKLDPFSDGAGLPGNPDLKLAKPKYAQAAFVAKPGVTPMSIVLNYHKGLLGFGPVKR